jgi:hypothetical protein
MEVLMPWMRVSIGVGLFSVLAGVAGMMLWIDDRSNYFDLAVAVASTGFLTLIACLLTRVFGSSHGSQDDAFRRGRSMGYDAGYLEGHRSARPVVVPLRLVGSDPEVAVSDPVPAEESEAPLPPAPLWRRETQDGPDRWGRGTSWARARRTPLLVGALGLAVICIALANMIVYTPTSTEAAPLAPGTVFHRDVPRTGTTPALVGKAAQGKAPVAAISGLSPVVPAAAGGVAAVTVGDPAVTVGAQPTPNSPPGTSAPAPTIYLPVGSPLTPPAVVVPVVAAPAAPLTAAQQTAADAAAAAALTKANAKAAADLTAANAAAAAAETARVAAAAAEATRLQAAADAYAVAHPAG